MRQASRRAPSGRRWAVDALLELRFTSAEAFAETLARDLRRGRAFVPGSGGLDVFMPVALLVVEPDGGSRRFEATVVMPPDQQAEQGGVGLMLEGDWKGVLAAEPEQEQGQEQAQAQAQEQAQGQEQALEQEQEAEADAGSTERGDVPLQLRLKRMNNAQQVRLARLSSNIQERTLLERMLGKQVWDSLLRNARITVPEVAKIARKGTVPRPLIERIVDNRSWLQAAPIRRALLSNPKLPRDGVMKILRATPKHELKLMVKGTAYPAAVRDAVRRILGGKA